MDGEDRPPELTPAEAARARRRDRDADAATREGMRTGLAKQFKQVLDVQTRRAAEAEAPAPGPKTKRPKPKPPKAKAPKAGRPPG